MTLGLDTKAPTFQHREDHSQNKKAVMLQEKTDLTTLSNIWLALGDLMIGESLFIT